MEDIKFDKRNYRIHNELNKKLIKKSLKECGTGRSIIIDNEGEIIGGNGVYEQAKELGIPVKIVETDGSELIAVKRTDLSTQDEKRKRLAVLDNTTSDTALMDVDLVIKDFGEKEAENLGVDINTEGVDVLGEEDSKYTRKVSLPIYEITGENPTIDEMVDTKKADLLIDEIEKSGLDKEKKEFLKKCATRLYEFNYGKVAEYYAHQDKETQEIMEKLALVLIDLGKAVENGYVELNEFIEKCFLEDKDA